MKLFTYFTNGSVDERHVKNITEGYDAANNVSTSSGKVSRLVLYTGDGERALWDKTWDTCSKVAGLRRPQ